MITFDELKALGAFNNSDCYALTVPEWAHRTKEWVVQAREGEVLELFHKGPYALSEDVVARLTFEGCVCIPGYTLEDIAEVLAELQRVLLTAGEDSTVDSPDSDSD